MVPETRELIIFLRSQFEYRNGILYWAEGTRRHGKKAGCVDSDGYTHINVTFPSGQHKRYLAHRIIFTVAHGYMPNIVDHIDQDPTNNLLSNLRDATKRLNAINTGLPSNNTSGVKGVRFYKGGYEAYINIKVNSRKKKIHIGRFKTIEDATTARQQAEQHYWADIRGTESSTSGEAERDLQTTGDSEEVRKSSELRQRIWSQPKEDSFDIPDAITYGY